MDVFFSFYQKRGLCEIALFFSARDLVKPQHFFYYKPNSPFLLVFCRVYLIFGNNINLESDNGHCTFNLKIPLLIHSRTSISIQPGFRSDKPQPPPAWFQMLKVRCAGSRVQSRCEGEPHHVRQCCECFVPGFLSSITGPIFGNMLHIVGHFCCLAQ